MRKVEADKAEGFWRRKRFSLHFSGWRWEELRGRRERWVKDMVEDCKGEDDIASTGTTEAEVDTKTPTKADAQDRQQLASMFSPSLVQPRTDK